MPGLCATSLLLAASSVLCAEPEPVFDAQGARERLAEADAAIWFAEGAVQFAARIDGDEVFSIGYDAVQMQPLDEAGTWGGCAFIERGSEAVMSSGFYAKIDEKYPRASSWARSTAVQRLRRPRRVLRRLPAR